MTIVRTKALLNGRKKKTIKGKENNNAYVDISMRQMPKTSTVTIVRYTMCLLDR